MMIDAITIFTKGGVVLWSYYFTRVKGNPIELLIKKVLLEEKVSEPFAHFSPFNLKWKLASELSLVFVVVYQGIQQLLLIDSLLDSVKIEFFKFLAGRDVFSNLIVYGDFDKVFLKALEKNELLYQKKALSEKKFLRKSAVPPSKQNTPLRDSARYKVHSVKVQGHHLNNDRGEMSKNSDLGGTDEEGGVLASDIGAAEGGDLAIPPPQSEEAAGSSHHIKGYQTAVKAEKKFLPSSHQAVEEEEEEDVCESLESGKEKTKNAGLCVRGRTGGDEEKIKRADSSLSKKENVSEEESYTRGGGAALTVQEARLRIFGQLKKMPGGRKGKFAEAVVKPNGVDRSEKVLRSWTSNKKITKKNMEALDYSKKGDFTEQQDALTAAQYMDGSSENDQFEIASISDEDSAVEDVESELSAFPSSLTLFARMTSAVKNLAGNVLLTEEALEPILQNFKDELMRKNVSMIVSSHVADSVKLSLLGSKSERFTSVKSTVKVALENAVEKILTPDRPIDVLACALEAKQKGKVYSIVFLGVNGVGKSTSLAKVCYLLKTQGNLKVMIAACDTFRAGAVEQLRTHSRCLDVYLFEKGYGKDASQIAFEALAFAKKNEFDVVLVDTAGRMQDNAPLMQAIAKLVSINNPDIILFVGEALVGNDGIDQVMKFNSALTHSKGGSRSIDGILLTKFDTVDDKVGAALSMVYMVGRPIVFVGNGQKYTSLRKLNAKNVVKMLFG